MIVHRGTEEHREKEKRNPGFDELDLLETEKASSPAFLKHGDHEAIGRAHREQIHENRLERHDDGPEDKQQKNKRQPQNEKKYPDGGAVYGVEIVDHYGGLPCYDNVTARDQAST